MFIVNYYIINLQMMLMLGEYNRYGKLYTRVLEVDKSFLVEKAPLEVLKDTINYIGYDLNGARSASKLILENVMLRPVMVNPIHGICVFPNKTYKDDDTIWFNPFHIINTSAFGKNTMVELSNGVSIEVHSRLSQFNTRLQSAEHLRRITSEISNSRVTFILEKNNKKLLKNGSSSSYNFDSF